MILRSFSLYDRKTLSFWKPFFFLHEGEAQRALAELVRDLSTMVGKYPTDFDLVEVGEFDDQTGGYQPCLPRVVCNAASLLPPGRASMPLFERHPDQVEGEVV